MQVEPDRGEFMFWVEFDVEGKGVEGKFLYLDQHSFEVLDEPRDENHSGKHAA